MTNLKLAGIALSALIMSAIASSDAEAKGRHKRQARGEDIAAMLRQSIALQRRQDIAIEKLHQEVASLNAKIAPGAAALNVTQPPRNPALASFNPLPDAPAPKVAALHVFPVTGTQGGQFGDQRRTHRHAGIDIRAPNGSPVVAAFAGKVIAKCKGCGDRGYGPNVVLVRGDDDIIYRYAHLSRVAVRPGMRVAAGQSLGGVGLGHLHYENHRAADFPRHPYGLKSALNPNNYLGGRRGTRMVAGAGMTGEAAKRYALRFAPSKVAEAP